MLLIMNLPIICAIKGGGSTLNGIDSESKTIRRYKVVIAKQFTGGSNCIP